MYLPLPENEPNAWVEEFDNPQDFEFSLISDEELGEPNCQFISEVVSKIQQR